MTTDQPTHPAETLHVLVVCTANRCRSPVAEVLLWRELILLAGPELHVHTLRSFAPLASGIEATSGGVDWLRAVTAAHPLDAFVGDGRADEIHDPIGKPASAHGESIDQIAQACEAVAAVVATHWP